MVPQDKCIYFRLDFGGVIGRGHLSRCLTMAHVFAEKGYKPILIIRKRPSTENVILPFKVIWLKETGEAPSSCISSWRTGSEEEELHELLDVINDNSTVVLDHYGLGKHWQAGFRKASHQLVLIQDVLSLDFESDVLINYTINSGMFFDHHRKESTTYLLGSNYTPVSPEYLAKRASFKRENAEVNTVGIYLGGVEHKYLGTLAEALGKSKFFSAKNLEWVVNSESEKQIVLQSFPKLTVHVRLPGLLPLYERCQLFLGACGVATFERACLGLPQMIFSIADNQKDTVDGLLAHKYGVYLGDVRYLSKDEVLNALETGLRTPQAENTMRFFEAIDGKGACRIVDGILAVQDPKLQIRRATHEDSEFLFDLRNQASIREMSRNSEKIEWQSHVDWYKKALSNSELCIYIGLYDNQRMGQFRIAPNGDVGVSISEAFKGKGLGTKLIVKGTMTYKESNAEKVTAVIKEVNVASARAFIKAGYIFVENFVEDGIKYGKYIY
ncbi:MAG TPA: bifunctional UDP-2,4-diacetamido-2,4,6-trideoxy-beta-L-altropyranose hydrolase/GNAT family N-acetyltransferase [Bacteriovoracaceae bacterium]|nr:bifunctional UDP-2,4-diacetamido-2,4,6-trideoxy-beta-L-altropyranose hydrolase/GNAT family N-acetyltransferase [Bacteriovoracaceae bacterium]